jgi:large subunit ribosomal protein L29
MKKKELQKITAEEIQKKLVDLRLELMTLQGQAATGTPPKNPGRIKQLRRTIAKLLTKQNQPSEEKK